MKIMKDRILAIGFLSLFFIFTLSAQNNQEAEKILDKFLDNLKNKGIKTDFTLTVKDLNAQNTYMVSGSFLLKGNKFTLETNEMDVYFDGKTQWVYSPQIEEVSITEPAEDELAEINPMMILNTYKSKCDTKFSSKKAADSNFQYIEMQPKNKNDNLKLIELKMKKNTNNLESIIITEKNGNTTNLQLKNYNEKLVASDKMFVFDKSKYPNVEVNDLR